MNKRLVHIAGLCVLLSALAACGSAENVQTGAPAAPQAPARLAAASPTTTVPPTVKDSFLYDIPTVADSGDVTVLHGPAKVNGAVFQNSTYQSLSCALGLSWDFDLNRVYKHFHAIAGVTDSSLAADKVTFAILTDGSQKASVTVELGKPQQIDVDLTGALRLRVQVTRTGGNLCSSSQPIGTYVVLGDAKVSK